MERRIKTNVVPFTPPQRLPRLQPIPQPLIAELRRSIERLEAAERLWGQR